MTRALIVLPSESFSESEYSVLIEKLKAEGFEVQVACSHHEAYATGDLVVKANLTLEEVKPEDYELVVFVGGVGSKEYWRSPTAQKIAEQAHDAGNVVAAGRSATVILANAGLLKDRHATGPLSLADTLRAQGADYTTHEVAEDHNIVTLRRWEGLRPYADILIERAKRKKAA